MRPPWFNPAAAWFVAVAFQPMGRFARHGQRTNVTVVSGGVLARADDDDDDAAANVMF